VKQSPSWEADSHRAGQEIPRRLWTSRVHYGVHKSPPLDPISSHLNPIHTPTPCLYDECLYSGGGTKIKTKTILGRKNAPPPKKKLLLVSRKFIFETYTDMRRSRDSSVSIVTRLQAGIPGFDSWLGQGILLLATTSRPVLGTTQPPIQWVQGALSPGVKRSRREADHSPPPSAELKNTWSYTSTPPTRLHGVVLG